MGCPGRRRNRLPAPLLPLQVSITQPHPHQGYLTNNTQLRDRPSQAQGRPPTLLRHRLGRASRELRGQGRGALARPEHLVCWNSPLQVDDEVARPGETLNEVVRTQ